VGHTSETVSLLPGSTAPKSPPKMRPIECTCSPSVVFTVHSPLETTVKSSVSLRSLLMRLVTVRSVGTGHWDRSFGTESKPHQRSSQCPCRGALALWPLWRTDCRRRYVCWVKRSKPTGIVTFSDWICLVTTRGIDGDVLKITSFWTIWVILGLSRWGSLLSDLVINKIF